MTKNNLLIAEEMHKDKGYTLGTEEEYNAFVARRSRSGTLYKYDNQYQTLQQWDEHGILRASMSMPKSDLNLLASLNIKENILQ